MTDFDDLAEDERDEAAREFFGSKAFPNGEAVRWAKLTEQEKPAAMKDWRAKHSKAGPTTANERDERLLETVAVTMVNAINRAIAPRDLQIAALSARIAALEELLTAFTTPPLSGEKGLIIRMDDGRVITRTTTVTYEGERDVDRPRVVG